MDKNSDYRVRVFGYCSLGEEPILEKFLREGPQGLRDLKGEYTLVIEASGECCIITSPCGLCQYYYVLDGDKFFHGDTVAGVLKKSSLQWSWNWRALADLTIMPLEHVLGDDTLHPRVHRVPAGSIVHFREGALDVSTQPWEELHPSFRADPEAALAALNDETEYWVSDDAVLSMSGGLDSRVLLSGLLKSGCRPLLLTLGAPDSTDASISRQIASTLGLQFLPVSVELDQFLQHGRTIATLTNGTLLAYHWHTYLYPLNAKLDPGRPFFVGTGGEFARRQYLDKGVLARAAGAAPLASLRHFWRPRMRPLFSGNEVHRLCPGLASELSEEGHRERVRRLIRLCHESVLSGFNRFFLEQWLRNFGGNGVKLYCATVSWRSSFLNRDWINAIWNLKMRWKFGSNWHRFALERNCPELLRFPEGGREETTFRRAPLLYWWRYRKLSPTVPFIPYPEWFCSDIICDFIRDNASLLSDLIEEETVLSIIKEHKREKTRLHAVALFVTMIFWRMVVGEPR